MSKNKLKKFAQMAQMPNVFELELQKILKGENFQFKGLWREQIFKNQNPIILELGCGRGEYTLGLAKMFPDSNYIGIDIKGARMWSGASEANLLKLSNAAFVRTEIQNISVFFAGNEIDEIWLTFPDPQMKKLRKRLTSTHFLNLYKKVLKDNGKIHLKTDSNFLFTYTDILVEKNLLKSEKKSKDIYSSDILEDMPELNIKTYYESQWFARGISIKYLEFELSRSSILIESEVEIEFDPYRSYGRQKRAELGLKA
ncbi:MAG: tRNA (guanosine(46)-N7)-methyltransferase TrmB [Prevotellaceae bacterium]|jgi:tRNA (guanine-N7-)-methyltransferase|nr:tRNA (guanosine(46)-N7)-methyltransferase TrmB [Prevotellaceae bacterium]